MPVAAFTFGSFGDITTILQLAWTIRQSLSASGSGQIAVLIADLDTFTCVLQQVKAELGARTNVPKELRNGIGLALETCFAALTAIGARIETHKVRTTRAIGRLAWGELWAACAWEILGEKQEIEMLRKRVFEQVNVIQILLSASHSRNLEQIRKESDSQGRDLYDITTGLNRLYKRLAAESASFAFFDCSGGQLMPLAVMPYRAYARFFRFMRAEWDHPGRLDTLCHNLMVGEYYHAHSISFDMRSGTLHWKRESRGFRHERALQLGNSETSDASPCSGTVNFILGGFVHFDPAAPGDLDSAVVFVSPVHAAHSDHSHTALSSSASAGLAAVLKTVHASSKLHVDEALLQSFDMREFRRLRRDRSPVPQPVSS